jgi:hypothetical protein
MHVRMVQPIYRMARANALNKDIACAVTLTKGSSQHLMGGLQRATLLGMVGVA